MPSLEAYYEDEDHDKARKFAPDLQTDLAGGALRSARGPGAKQKSLLGDLCVQRTRDGCD